MNLIKEYNYYVELDRIKNFIIQDIDDRFEFSNIFLSDSIISGIFNKLNDYYNSLYPDYLIKIDFNYNENEKQFLSISLNVKRR